MMITDEQLVELLKELAETPGVSGSEGDVIKKVHKLITPFTDQVKIDPFGNLVALKKGDSSKNKPLNLALIAHVDEIGAIVTEITEGGFLRFAPIGGIDPRVLPGLAVLVHGREMRKAVIGSTAPHLLSEENRKKTVPLDKLFIDTGLSVEKVRKLVRVGDPVSFDYSPLLSDNKKMITGKALDNRAGVAALVYCAALLAGLRHNANLYFIASLQEEVGLRGALTAAYHLKPDLAVAVDVTHGDMPGVDDSRTFSLGGGPVVAVGPNIHPFIAGEMQKKADEHNISYQVEPIPGPSGTDAWVFQVSRKGIPTGLLSLPLRYMHSTAEMLNLEDLRQCGRLLAFFAAGLTDAVIQEMSKC